MNIRNPNLYLSSFWHWENFNDCFEDTNIRITDVDGLIERKGHFLLLETKLPGVDVPKGQAILFDAIIKQKNWNVLVIWGKTDMPRHWKLWGKEKVYSGGLFDLKDFISRWFHHADSNP